MNFNQGQLRAWGAAFGLDFPADNAIQHGQSGPQIPVFNSEKPANEWAKKRLINLSDGFCYLQATGGQFDGKDEVAKVYSEDGKCKLAVRGLCKNLEGWDLISSGPCIERKQIKATASCYLYDQIRQ